ncbi:gluconate 2-dehydrogenase subunit 3 family protein [Echinicola sp. CAU 1574]|uniref:Gluconate 2-dehydrogenase subunit 3 family protein n=1 Tax=Echinicola arenosa TaxID=2774144 RepID=A0ABR9ASZ6_9BACT|nr:gluconate 2-dehydrogenase subunit 3 family protein [Echinicola arenosa]MBD8491030.1 gluconate 2-dehydrogenase subunit 3 family protein [Echinicola arenosa]
MDRRLALKQMALLTGGLALIPGCDFSEEKILAAYDELQITEGQQEMLKLLVDTFIPKTDLKGAAELGVHDFVLVMANDCLGEEDQTRFVNGLKGFDEYVKASFGKRFAKMDKPKAEETLLAIVGKEAGGDEDLEQYQYFLNTTKRYTLQGYMASEYVMTELMPYHLVPGPNFKGSKKIVAGEKVNING